MLTLTQVPLAASRLLRSTVVRHPEPPEAVMPAGPPAGRSTFGELLTATEPARLLTRSPWLANAPRGDGRIVIDIPGWRAPELSLAPLRAYLSWLGHSTRPWGLGLNRGDAERDVALLAESVAALAASRGRPVALVGWSLGGVIARETAREIPDHVAGVVTFGTPVIGGPSYTLGATSYGAEECTRIEALATKLDRDNPIRVPVTAIFTRNDGVVAWQACIDRTTPGVEHIEVRSTHLGLGLDPDVWRAVAGSLVGLRD